MHTTANGYFPVDKIESDHWISMDFESLWLRFVYGSNSINISVNAETPEMRALFAAIHSAINMPALVRPLDEIDAEAAEYEETRKVTVCEDCGQAHG